MRTFLPALAAVGFLLTTPLMVSAGDVQPVPRAKSCVTTIDWSIGERTKNGGFTLSGGSMTRVDDCAQNGLLGTVIDGVLTGYSIAIENSAPLYDHVVRSTKGDFGNFDPLSKNILSSADRLPHFHYCERINDPFAECNPAVGTIVPVSTIDNQ